MYEIKLKYPFDSSLTTIRLLTKGVIMALKMVMPEKLNISGSIKANSALKVNAVLRILSDESSSNKSRIFKGFIELVPQEDSTVVRIRTEKKVYELKIEEYP